MLVETTQPLYTTLISTTLAEINALLTNYVYNGYSALSDYLQLPLSIIAAIYIVLLGYAIVMGWVQVRMGNFVKAALKIGWIYTVVGHWAWVSEYIVGFINSAVGELGSALISASPIQVSGADGVNGALQVVLTQFTQLGATLFNTGGVLNVGGWFGGVVVWAFGYGIVGIGFFEWVLAQVMLAILCIFTPLMVLFCFFKPLQPIFDRWLGALIGFALLQLFVTAALALALSLSYGWVSAHAGETALQIGNYGMLPIVIVGILCIGLVLKAASLAQNLGGMVSGAAGSALVGGIIGGAIGSAEKIKGTYNKYIQRGN